MTDLKRSYMTEPRIVTLDIETAPSLAWVWQYFKANIGSNQVQESGYTMSFAHKWLGDSDIFYSESRTDS